MIKALFFDVFGTVVDWRSSVAEDLAQFGIAKGLERDWTAMAVRWRSMYQPAMDAVRNGQRAYVKLDILHRENLDQLLTEFEMTDVSETERQALTLLWHRLRPWPDSPPGLARLKQGFIIAPVSNGNVSLMVNLARNGNLPWDTILGAETAQNFKPTPDVYLKSAEALDLKPDECMMVAAHNYDLKAARPLGLKTAFVARRTEHGPGQTIDLEPKEDWTYSAENMEDLARQLNL